MSEVDRLSDIEYPWCPRCGVIDGPLVPGEDDCGVCYEEDGANEAVEYVVFAADYRGAVAENERLREALDAIRRDDFDRAIHPSAAALAGYVLNAARRT